MGLNFARGTAAIEEAAKNTGKKFSPFTPQIQWKGGDEKYIAFLTDIEDAASVLLHEWIDCGVKKMGDKEFPDYGFFISRKDPAIGEDVDPLTDKGSNPKKRILAVAVELEPVMSETGGAHKRPKGFTIKTQEYTRKTDDGDEEVTAPVIGVVTQASKNFFKLLVSHAESEGPIQDTAFKIRRIGNDGDTTYAFTPYFDQPVDLSELIANIDGVSYLESDEDTWAEIEACFEVEDEKDQAMGIAAVLLNKRLNELADEDLYHEKTDHIEKIESKYGDDNSKKEKKDRPSRRSQRSTSEASVTASPAATQAKKSDRFAEIKAMADKKKAERESKA